MSIQPSLRVAPVWAEITTTPEARIGARCPYFDGSLGELDDARIDHVEEELGDLLFQIVFHAELGDEEGNFNFATIADGVRDKLIGRHPHVFGDVTVSGADEVASRWEDLKRVEKGRDSVTDGIAWQLPSLTLYTKLLRKAALVGAALDSGDVARERRRP